MQDIEYDMDDLFRKAAENYPLKSGDSNWESISKKIIDPNYEAKPIKIIKPGIRRKYVLLIFLMIGLVISWVILKNTGHEERIFSYVKNDGETSKAGNIKKPSTENAEGLTKSTVNSSNQNRKQNSIHEPVKRTSLFINKSAINQYGKSAGIIGKKYRNKKNQISCIAFLKKQNLLSKIQIANSEEISNNSSGIFDKKIDKKIQTDLLINKNGNSTKENEIKKNNKNNLINKQGGYIGFIGSVDFSNVKSIIYNNAGYGFGVLLGYKFNKKISLETGLIANKKNYYSDGRYFNMDKIQSAMPTGMHLKSLFTNSSIIEIPIKIMYDFIANNKSNVYVSCGFSAYIMTTEKNNYKAMVNGNEEQFYEVYNKSGYRLPAVVNINFGYEHLVSKFLNIRIAPFLKIPLKGIGVGNLPVTSAGLQLSFTHNLN